MWPFWKEGVCLEVVREQGNQTLFAAMVAGFLKFGEVDWSEPKPSVRKINDRETLEAWDSPEVRAAIRDFVEKTLKK